MHTRKLTQNSRFFSWERLKWLDYLIIFNSSQATIKQRLTRIWIVYLQFTFPGAFVVPSHSWWEWQPNLLSNPSPAYDEYPANSITRGYDRRVRSISISYATESSSADLCKNVCLEALRAPPTWCSSGDVSKPSDSLLSSTGWFAEESGPWRDWHFRLNHSLGFY